MIQQSLDLKLNTPPAWRDFIVGENQQVVFTLQELLAQPLEKGVYLYGSKGAGKSLLLNIVVNQFKPEQAAFIDLATITQAQMEAFKISSHLKVVAFDHVETVSERRLDEAFFMLINQLLDAKICPVYAASDVPQNLAILADLQSRLAWATIYKLRPLKEAHMSQGLTVLAERQGLHLSEEVIQFLLSRVQRDMAELSSILSILSQASLESHRKLTIPFIKQVLKI